MKKSLEQSILETLAFYETRGCGRTADQLWPYLLNCSPTRSKLKKALRRLVESKRIVKVDDNYGLSIMSAKRTANAMEWATKKRSVAQRIAKVMAHSPFIKMVALTQSVTMETAKESSDVDIFTITATNRLWTARFLALAKLKLARLAKRKGRTTDRGCFGFWLDETALNLLPIALENDIYLSFWLAHLTPLINRDRTYERFISQNNRLLARFPNWRRNITGTTRGVSGSTKIFEWLLGGRIGDWVESILFKFQAKKIWRDKIAHRTGASVVANRTMCKLHHFDARAEIRDQWRTIVEKVDKDR